MAKRVLSLQLCLGCPAEQSPRAIDDVMCPCAPPEPPRAVLPEGECAYEPIALASSRESVPGCPSNSYSVPCLDLLIKFIVSLTLVSATLGEINVCTQEEDGSTLFRVFLGCVPRS